MSNRRGRRSESGQGLPQTLVALGLFLIVLTSAGFAMTKLSSTEVKSIATTQMESAADAFQRSLDEEGSQSLAIFIPTQDVLGVANPVPAAGSVAQPNATTAFDPTVSPAANTYATAAHEIDFYQRDGTHTPHLTAYLWNPTTSIVNKYAYAYRDGNGVAQGVQLEQSIGDVTWFGASYLDASQLPDVNPFVKSAVMSSGSPIADKLIYMGEPQIYGGNRGTVVEYAFGVPQQQNGKTVIADPIADSVTLAPTTFPGGRTVVTTYAASHNALSVNCSSFEFQAGVAPSIAESGSSCPVASGGDSFVASDSNYTGTYTLSSPNCAADGVSITPTGGTNGPTAGYTIGTSSGVTPGTTVSCLLNILTTDPNITASVAISVMATPTPTPTRSPTPTPAPPTPTPIPPTNAPTATPTCPPNYQGTYPNCVPDPTPPTPTPPGSTAVNSFERDSTMNINGACHEDPEPGGFTICTASGRTVVGGPYAQLAAGTQTITLTESDTCNDPSLIQITSSDGELENVATGQWSYPMPANGTIDSTIYFTVTMRYPNSIGDGAGNAPAANGPCNVALTFSG